MPQEKSNPRQPVLKAPENPAHTWARKSLTQWSPTEYEEFRKDALTQQEIDFMERPKQFVGHGKDVNLPIEKDAKKNALTRAAIIAELGKKK